MTSEQEAVVNIEGSAELKRTGDRATFRMSMRDLFRATTREVGEAVEDYVLFYQKWIPIIKVFLTELSVNVARWLFYFSSREAHDLGKVGTLLVIFNYVSTVLGLMTVTGMFLDQIPKSTYSNWSASRRKRMSFISKEIHLILGIELLIEDLPFIILTAWMTNDFNGGVYTSEAAFSMTTSVFNFIFNFLDMLVEMEDEENRSAEQYSGDKKLVKKALGHNKSTRNLSAIM